MINMVFLKDITESVLLILGCSIWKLVFPTYITRLHCILSSLNLSIIKPTAQALLIPEINYVKANNSTSTEINVKDPLMDS